MGDMVYQQAGVTNPYLCCEIGGGSDSTLYGMATHLLGLVESVYQSEGVGLPERRVLYMSPIPADCEQVAVLFTGWSPYPTFDGPVSCQRYRWMGDFSVIVTRCTPAMAKGTKNLTPPAEKMSDAALLASTDAEMMLKVLEHIEEFATPQVIVQSPTGGLQTTELNVQIPAGSL
ncbi:MAG: hypothetical protein ACOYD1_07690 [Candidatus Nanopelagicales bacterium]